MQVVADVHAWAREGHVWAVRGNHDEAALREIAAAAAAAAAAGQHGSPTATVPGKYAWLSGLADGDALFLASLPYSITLQGCAVITPASPSV
jgi:hypothetical protein